MPFTTATANKIINKIIKGTDFTAPTAIYVSLHTADPAETGVSEVTGGSYVRKVATFGTVDNKEVSNTTDIEFPNMPTTTVTHIGLWGSNTAGVFWWGGALTASKPLTAGDTIRIPSGDLDITLT